MQNTWHFIFETLHYVSSNPDLEEYVTNAPPHHCIIRKADKYSEPSGKIQACIQLFIHWHHAFDILGAKVTMSVVDTLKRAVQ